MFVIRVDAAVWELVAVLCLALTDAIGDCASVGCAVLSRHNQNIHPKHSK